jgi:hypothetical protein
MDSSLVEALRSADLSSIDLTEPQSLKHRSVHGFDTLHGAEKTYVNMLKSQNTVDAHHQLAIYYINHGKPAKAVYHCQQVLFLDPNDTTAPAK